MATETQACGNCQWWKSRGLYQEGVAAGECVVPIPMWARVDDDYWTPDYLFNTEGKDCPTWTPK